MEGLGAGLSALAFWGFIAAVSLGGLWYSIREKEMRHETLRRLLESGKSIDQSVLDQVLTESDTVRTDVGLRIGGTVTLAVGPGLAIMGQFLGGRPAAVLLGIGALIVCIGIGLLVASVMTARWYAAQEKPKQY